MKFKKNFFSKLFKIRLKRFFHICTVNVMELQDHPGGFKKPYFVFEQLLCLWNLANNGFNSTNHATEITLWEIQSEWNNFDHNCTAREIRRNERTDRTLWQDRTVQRFRETRTAFDKVGHFYTINQNSFTFKKSPVCKATRNVESSFMYTLCIACKMGLTYGLAGRGQCTVRLEVAALSRWLNTGRIPWRHGQSNPRCGFVWSSLLSSLPIGSFPRRMANEQPKWTNTPACGTETLSLLSPSPLSPLPPPLCLSPPSTLTSSPLSLMRV